MAQDKRKPVGPRPLNGTSVFPELRSNPNYQDRSPFLEEILCSQRIKERAGESDITEADGEKVMLFSRPRRFGKSSILSMLEYFLSVRHREISPKLFKGLAIEKRADICKAHQGQYPVIKLDLGEIKATTFKSFIGIFKTKIRRLFIAHASFNNVRGKDQNEAAELEALKEVFNAYKSRKAEGEEWTDSLQLLCECLYRQYGKKAIILIDEYDAPFHAAYAGKFEHRDEGEEFRKIKAFLGAFFRSSLKSNEYFERAVICGVLRVSQMSLFSDMNNVAYYSTLSPKFSGYFGFSETEVEGLVAKRFGNEAVEEIMADLRAWYNGYTFGGRSLVYNPWSIISYLMHGRLEPYWVNTGNPQLLVEALREASSEVHLLLRKLIQGEEVTCWIEESTTFKGLENADQAIWGLLLTSGYLTVEKILGRRKTSVQCVARVPNHEVTDSLAGVMETWIREQLSGSMAKLMDFYQTIREGNAEGFQAYVQTYIEQHVSYFDLGKKTPERVYHVLILGLIAGMREDYIPESNKEWGFGRPDLVMFPRSGKGRGIIMEFKSTANAKNLAKEAKMAVAQIKQQRYSAALKGRDLPGAIYMGIAFSGKRMHTVVEMIDWPRPAQLSSSKASLFAHSKRSASGRRGTKRGRNEAEQVAPKKARGFEMNKAQQAAYTRFAQKLVGTAFYQDGIGKLTSRGVRSFCRSDDALMTSAQRQILLLHEVERIGMAYDCLQPKSPSGLALSIGRDIIILPELDSQLGPKGIQAQLIDVLTQYKGYTVHLCWNPSKIHYSTLSIKPIAGGVVYRYVDPLHDNHGELVGLSDDYQAAFLKAMTNVYPGSVGPIDGIDYHKQQDYKGSHNNECGFHNIYNTLYFVKHGLEADLSKMKTSLKLAGDNPSGNGGLDPEDARQVLRPQAKALFRATLEAQEILRHSGEATFGGGAGGGAGAGAGPLRL